MEGRGRLGSKKQWARYATISVSDMRSRSSRGSTSSSRKPVNDAAVTVARSDPDPFTHSTRVGRPR